jgi:hypothetical protein
MIKYLFEQYISSLKEWNLNNYDKNIINLIYNNFDDIKKLWLRSWRWKKISELIVSNISSWNLEIPKISNSDISKSTTSNQNKIWKIEVWHFRGFQDVQEFNFW